MLQPELTDWRVKQAVRNTLDFLQQEHKRQLEQIRATLQRKKEDDKSLWPEDFTLKRFTIVESMMIYSNASRATRSPGKILKAIDALFQTINAQPLLEDFVEPDLFKEFRWNLCVQHQFGETVGTTSKIASRVAELDLDAGTEFLSLGITSVLLQSKEQTSEVLQKLVAGLSDCDRCKRSSWSAM